MTKKIPKELDTMSEADYNPDEMNEEDIVVEESGGDATKKLREKLKKCVAEKQEYLDGWQKAKADFVNFKKGEEERKDELRKFAKEDLVESLLPVLDSFNMALTHNSDDEGLEQVYKQFLRVLEKEGVEEINPEGEDFDPNKHEAVEMVDGEEGCIMEVLQRGYSLNKKIIRPARVKVGK